MTNDSEARQATSEPPKPDQTARTFTFNWRFGSPKASDAEPSGELEGPPQTYYEALSGRRDPQRELFVSARKWLNRGVNAIALAFPVIGLTIGFLSGGDLLTTLLLGFGGAVIGLMFKTSFPRTPFDRSAGRALAAQPRQGAMTPRRRST